MAKIQLLIEIEERLYKNIIDNDKDDEEFEAMDDAFNNAKPLPKGHGRLIDADALMEYCQNDKSKVIDCNDIARFPTIIRREE